MRIERHAPTARALALPLPGFGDADETTTAPVTPSATPANDARSIRRAKAILADFSAPLAAAMAPALAPLARIEGAPTSDVEADALNTLPLRTDLSLSLAQGASGWEARVARTLWEGEATVRVVYATRDEAALVYGTATFVCQDAETLARRVTGWLSRFEGPVRVAEAHAIDVDTDGRTVASLRWRDSAWTLVDDDSERARVEAARAAARRAEAPATSLADVEAAIDADETEEAIARQRKAVEGLSLRCLDEPEERPATTHATVVSTIVSASPDVAPTRRRKAPALRVVSSMGDGASTAKVTSGYGGPPKREETARTRKAARSPAGSSPKGKRGGAS